MYTRSFKYFPLAIHTLVPPREVLVYVNTNPYKPITNKERIFIYQIGKIFLINVHTFYSLPHLQTPSWIKTRIKIPFALILCPFFHLQILNQEKCYYLSYIFGSSLRIESVDLNSALICFCFNRPLETRTISLLQGGPRNILSP